MYFIKYFYVIFVSRFLGKLIRLNGYIILKNFLHSYGQSDKYCDNIMNKMMYRTASLKNSNHFFKGLLMSAADFLSIIANTVILLHHNVYCKKNITKEWRNFLTGILHHF